MDFLVEPENDGVEARCLFFPEKLEKGGADERDPRIRHGVSDFFPKQVFLVPGHERCDVLTHADPCGGGEVSEKGMQCEAQSKMS